MKVLVVDDDETIRALVSRLFARRGDTVGSAVDGADAIACLEAGSFDLLILDLMMPRTDGLGVLAYLRDRPAPSPKIVVMSAAVPTLVDSIPRGQVAALITKPFDIASVLRIADEAVGAELPSSSDISGPGMGSS